MVSSYSDVIITPKSASEYYEIVSSGTVFVEFVSNKMCTSCKYYTQYYESLANKYSNSDAKFLIVDIDELGEVRSREAVSSVPVYVAYKNGRRVERLLQPTEEQLENFVNRWTKSIY